MTPIERMIDKACGFDRANHVPPLRVTLRCPKCLAENPSQLSQYDPEGTALVVFPCNDCREPTEPDVLYFDENGKALEQ